MPLHIVRNDIIKMKVDAVVTSANQYLQGGGGVDGAVHRAAGPQLLAECRRLHGCRTGDAKITGGYNLPAKYIIHAVGPVWQGGKNHEDELLASCYQKSLELARAHDCQSVAFPLIASGVYAYPKARALQIAMSTISTFLLENEMEVYIVVYDKNTMTISEKLFSDIEEYIDDIYVEVNRDLERRRSLFSPTRPLSTRRYARPKRETQILGAPPMLEAEDKAVSLEEFMDQMDESFSQMLLRKIEEKGMKDSTCYKRANISRKLFSKIRSNIHYQPSKQTAIAFAIALELPMSETRSLLMKAGYALSHANKFDIIIEYFIMQGKYDIFEINQVLFSFDQPILGS